MKKKKQDEKVKLNKTNKQNDRLFKLHNRRISNKRLSR